MVALGPRSGYLRGDGDWLRASGTNVTGVAAGSFGGTFTAIGTRGITGVAAGSFGGSFVGAGTPKRLGIATASFGFSGVVIVLAPLPLAVGMCLDVVEIKFSIAIAETLVETDIKEAIDSST